MRRSLGFGAALLAICTGRGAVAKHFFQTVSGTGLHNWSVDTLLDALQALAELMHTSDEPVDSGFEVAELVRSTLLDNTFGTEHGLTDNCDVMAVSVQCYCVVIPANFSIHWREASRTFGLD